MRNVILSHAVSLVILCAFPRSSNAQAVTVVPQEGTLATRFVASINFICPCDFPPQLYVDNQAVVGQSGFGSGIRFPVALDTVCTSAVGGCSHVLGTVGTHTIRVDLFGDCDHCAYSVSTNITILAHHPVLLVHGICGASDDWADFQTVLEDSGFTVSRLDYGTPDFSLRPATYADTLAAQIEAISTDTVAVVAHSMGGLITREYIRRQLASGQPNRVSELITLGTPHHGSDLASVLVRWQRAVDVTTALALGPGEARFLFDFILPLFSDCLASPISRYALLDMIPGSGFLNRLNYGTDSTAYDPPYSHGWSLHTAESTLVPSTYYASIGGTGSFCKYRPIQNAIWGSGLTYQPNDLVVATGSALLAAPSAFRLTDGAAPLLDPITHADVPVVPVAACYTPYYRSTALAGDVSRIIRLRPSGSPDGAPPPARGNEAQSQSDIDVDSLQTLPAIVDSVAAGQIATHTVTIPTTTSLRVFLLSTDAHLYLQDPQGHTLVPADTATVPGLSYVSISPNGYDGYELLAPLPGTWTLRVDATGAAGLQRYACIASFANANTPSIATGRERIQVGDTLKILAQVANAGSNRSDVSWSCWVVGPNGMNQSVVLADDGLHGDGLSGDGVFGGGVVPSAGVGIYEVVGEAVVPQCGALIVGTACEVVPAQDLAISATDIYLSTNVPHRGDSLTIFARVHNTGMLSAHGARITVKDVVSGATLGTRFADIASGSSTTVSVPWLAVAPDTHYVQVMVSPFVQDESNLQNNVATRLVVYGSSVGVEPQPGSRATLLLDVPRPNPTTQTAVVSFALRVPGDARLTIFDVLGRRQREWRWKRLSAGRHTVEWDGTDMGGTFVSAGVYFCQLEVDGTRLSRRIVLRH